MSIEALDLMRDQRKLQIEQSPFSEEFQIVGGGSFRGIFDKSHEETNKDGGNIRQKNLSPAIMISDIPSGLIERASKIQREGWTTGDKIYTFRAYGKDEEGIPILWLF